MAIDGRAPEAPPFAFVRPEQRGRRRHGVGARPPAQLDVGAALCVVGSFGLAAAPPLWGPYDACHGVFAQPDLVQAM